MDLTMGNGPSHEGAEAVMARLREASFVEVALLYALARRELMVRGGRFLGAPDGVRAAAAQLDPLALRTLRVAAGMMLGEEEWPEPAVSERGKAVMRELADVLAVEQLTREDGP